MTALRQTSWGFEFFLEVVSEHQIPNFFAARRLCTSVIVSFRSLSVDSLRGSHATDWSNLLRAVNRKLFSPLSTTLRNGVLVPSVNNNTIDSAPPDTAPQPATPFQLNRGICTLGHDHRPHAAYDIGSSTWPPGLWDSNRHTLAVIARQLQPLFQVQCGLEAHAAQG